MNLESIQSEIQRTGLDGWIFFDHNERAPLAYRVLGLKPPGHVSRRWYYFIPARNEPRGLVHQVEPHVLNPLPGAKIPYARWQEQEAGLRKLLQDAIKVSGSARPHRRPGGPQRRASVHARRCAHAGPLQQLEGELVGVVGPLGSVGEDVERAPRHHRDAEVHAPHRLDHHLARRIVRGV
jgi:hypothetical protein